MSGNAYELPLLDGRVALIDEEDVPKLPKGAKWRVLHSNYKEVVGCYMAGKNSAIYLTKLILEYDKRMHTIKYRNGNRLDLRKENVYVDFRGGKPNKCNMFAIKKRAKVKEIQMGEFLLVKAKEGRCDDYLTCPNYEDCLDRVSHDTEWDGWRCRKA